MPPSQAIRGPAARSPQAPYIYEEPMRAPAKRGQVIPFPSPEVRIIREFNRLSPELQEKFRQQTKVAPSSLFHAFPDEGVVVVPSLDLREIAGKYDRLWNAFPHPLLDSLLAQGVVIEMPESLILRVVFLIYRNHQNEDPFCEAPDFHVTTLLGDPDEAPLLFYRTLLPFLENYLSERKDFYLSVRNKTDIHPLLPHITDYLWKYEPMRLGRYSIEDFFLGQWDPLVDAEVTPIVPSAGETFLEGRRFYVIDPAGMPQIRGLPKPGDRITGYRGILHGRWVYAAYNEPVDMENFSLIPSLSAEQREAESANDWPLTVTRADTEPVPSAGECAQTFGDLPEGVRTDLENWSNRTGGISSGALAGKLAGVFLGKGANPEIVKLLDRFLYCFHVFFLPDGLTPAETRGRLDPLVRFLSSYCGKPDELTKVLVELPDPDNLGDSSGYEEFEMEASLAKVAGPEAYLEILKQGGSRGPFSGKEIMSPIGNGPDPFLLGARGRGGDFLYMVFPKDSLCEGKIPDYHIATARVWVTYGRGMYIREMQGGNNAREEFDLFRQTTGVDPIDWLVTGIALSGRQAGYREVRGLGYQLNPWIAGQPPQRWGTFYNARFKRKFDMSPIPGVSNAYLRDLTQPDPLDPFPKVPVQGIRGWGEGGHYETIRRAFSSLGVVNDGRVIRPWAFPAP